MVIPFILVLISSQDYFQQFSLSYFSIVVVFSQISTGEHAHIKSQNSQQVKKSLSNIKKKKFYSSGFLELPL